MRLVKTLDRRFGETRCTASTTQTSSWSSDPMLSSRGNSVKATGPVQPLRPARPSRRTQNHTAPGAHSSINRFFDKA